MLSAAMIVLIFLGVAISVYQVYDIYYAQNFEDDERSVQHGSALSQLSRQAEEYAATGREQGFLGLIGQYFDSHFDRTLVFAAAMRPDAPSYLAALLRRRRQVSLDGQSQVRVPPLVRAFRAPAFDTRPILLTWVLVNCLVTMFLGGLSLYTIAYRVTAESLQWMNSEWVLMLLIYAVVGLTHLISRLDTYLHDFYLIGTLARVAER